MFQWIADNVGEYTLINNYKLSIIPGATIITDTVDNTIQKKFPYPTDRTSTTVAHETAIKFFKDWLFYEFYHMCTAQFIIHNNYHWNDDWYTTPETTKEEHWIDDFMIQTQYHDDNKVTITVWQQTENKRIKIDETMSENRGEVGNRGVGVQMLANYIVDRINELKQTKQIFESHLDTPHQEPETEYSLSPYASSLTIYSSHCNTLCYHINKHYAPEYLKFYSDASSEDYITFDIKTALHNEPDIYNTLVNDVKEIDPNAQVCPMIIS